MTTDAKKLEAFGQAFMNQVRDDVIAQLEMVLEGKAKAPYLQDLVQGVSNMSPEDQAVCLKLVLLGIDKSLARTLSFFEDGASDYQIAPETGGETISTLSDGLSGELYTEDGWVHRFSQKPKSILTE